MPQVDDLLVVDEDISASNTDNLFCPSPQGTACGRPEPIIRVGGEALPRYVFPIRVVLRFSATLCA